MFSFDLTHVSRWNFWSIFSISIETHEQRNQNDFSF